MYIINSPYNLDSRTESGHYDDVIMTTIASQITSLTVVCSIVYSDADERKHQSSVSLAFVWGIHRERWIPRTKGQLRGKCFHLMTSSWVNHHTHTHSPPNHSPSTHTHTQRIRNVNHVTSAFSPDLRWIKYIRSCFLKNVGKKFLEMIMHREHGWCNICKILVHIDGLVQDCSISMANALEILQSYTEPSIYV